MKVLFVTLHHKRSYLYEEGIKKLLDEGHEFLILNTGLDQGFGEFGLKDRVDYIDRGIHQNYDQALIDLKLYLSMRRWDIVHFIDNDLFITDTRHINRTLRDFEHSNFGFASYLENGFETNRYRFKGTLAQVTDQEFIPNERYATGLAGRPQWENAAMMFKRDTYDMLEREDFICTQAYIKKMSDIGIKLGVRKKEARLQYSHAGDGFIHIGNLMKYYYMMETFSLQTLQDTQLDRSRIGYFLYQRKLYGDYPGNVNMSIDIASKSLGEEKCMQDWLDLVKGYYESID